MRTVIIQAGGMGTRMGRHTRNKPKCLVPYNGKTILENNISVLKSCEIFVVVDHLSDVVDRYVKFILKREDIFIFHAKDKSTTAGIKEICASRPDSEVLVLWSDLYLPSDPGPKETGSIVVGLTDDFECRWSVQQGRLKREGTKKEGVMGLFWIPNFESIKDFDSSLSFVGGNLSRLDVRFETAKVEGVTEFGSQKVYEEAIDLSSKSRFFNEVKIHCDRVEKKCIDKSYEHLIEDEKRWYSFVDKKLDCVPEVVSKNPFTIGRISGRSPHLLEISPKEKKVVIERMCDNLSQLHSLGSCGSVFKDYEEIYVHKTFERVESVSSMIPFFRERLFNINGLSCENPFRDPDLFKSQIMLLFGDEYKTIHGDCTFSNIIVDASLKPYLIDPRGRFGSTLIYGDPNYDWAKMYYSVKGNYDSVNRKLIDVHIEHSGVRIECASNGYEEFYPMILEACGTSRDIIERLHSLIWLSLTGYVKEDIDSMMYSFYKGVLIWNYPEL
jgi:hypothetical protein